ncbi:Na(+)/H(+) antiporter subunit D [Halomicrobium urmianum]|uniref:Na(+)/H(+) antiporter subunit D n=1 Tax=Halomicrobium urmianum TaxID=1586233 RepID=UPI001CD929B0|nr:Na(+)/H(+) antiporter subunit D [Halomicrobium urmianum]
MSALTAVPPVVALLAVAVLVAILPRRVGHALGFLATGTAAAWSVVVPHGAHLETTFLGFRAVLLNVDQFSSLMGLIFGLIGAAAVLYSYASDADSTQTGFALSYVATSFGAVFAGDWLSLLFFWELMAITSTLLVWHYGGRAVRAGFRYALLHGIGGSLLMAAIVWHYVEVGTFLFAGVPGGPEAAGMVAGVPQVLAALGIGINVGFVGLHTWLPDTYPRPHIAASVFLCVYTTKTGVYGMYRAFPDEQLLIAYMGGTMAVFGAFYALLQKDMRRLLSYHIQSQVGYMIAGVGIGGILGTAGAFAHVFNHILYKALLFMTAGVIIYRTGEEDLGELGGLARKMPITAVAFTVAALSIAGFPYFNGFVSKGIVISASHYEFHDPIHVAGYGGLEALLLLGGVGTFMSFIKFGYYAFLRQEWTGEVRDANVGQTVAMLTIAGLCVLFGVHAGALYDLLPLDVHAETLEHPYHAYTTGHIVEGLGLAAAGLIGFAAVKKPLSSVHGGIDVDAVYNPLTFHGTRALVVGVTETYAAVDRAAVRTAGAVATAARHPETVVERVRPAGDEQPVGRLRAGIGFSILVLALFVTVALVLLS